MDIHDGLSMMDNENLNLFKHHNLGLTTVVSWSRAMLRVLSVHPNNKENSERFVWADVEKQCG